ncbi:DUF402 domain-containing protein [Polymorphospora rubra]|uniref:DUF402 domain-containing protein n=1 Tax=Polymorphospora rubra TaxID=338584 RepID=A0A810N5R8_9ACTN|nr:DUF402 domain-containing protein [Polymorphospora rubra]BCJ69091.1 hypothetical protein Prubr_61120 [Polymorphospora rubra]
MPYAEGQTVLRRYVRDGRYTWVQPMRVVRDDAAGLLLWHPVGGEYARVVDADGNTQHELSLDLMRDPRLLRQPWLDYDILVLMPPDTAYSVWWFFADGKFAGWYVNLEAPYRRHDDGVDTVDQVLDVRVDPDLTWRWKDEDEFVALTGHPLYFDAATADAVRAVGRQVIALAERAEYPFDGTYVDFTPDPAWPVPRMPAGWDRPDARP